MHQLLYSSDKINAKKPDMPIFEKQKKSTCYVDMAEQFLQNVMLQK